MLSWRLFEVAGDYKYDALRQDVVYDIRCTPSWGQILRPPFLDEYAKERAICT